jgi:hypothetical protein
MHCEKNYRIKYCNCEKPVVCCNPLCIFKYSEIIPQNKKNRMSEDDRITICPFTSYSRVDIKYMNRSLAVFGDTVVADKSNQEQMLQMQCHRYLPHDAVCDSVHSFVRLFVC